MSPSWTASEACSGDGQVVRYSFSVATRAIWAPGSRSWWAAARALEPGTLLDGELVVCDESGWADFGSLQERLSTARSGIADLAHRRPAVLVVFDLLERAGARSETQPMGTRRAVLERLLDGLHPCLQLVEQTADVELAQDWLSLPSLEGVVAKRVDRPYAPGRCRDWIKGAPRQVSSIQEVEFLRCQGLANQQQSSPALCKVTNMAKRGQSD